MGSLPTPMGDLSRRSHDTLEEAAQAPESHGDPKCLQSTRIGDIGPQGHQRKRGSREDPASGTGGHCVRGGAGGFHRSVWGLPAGSAGAGPSLLPAAAGWPGAKAPQAAARRVSISPQPQARRPRCLWVSSKVLRGRGCAGRAEGTRGRHPDTCITWPQKEPNY